MSDIIKVTRIVEYIGTEKWIRDTLNNGLIPSGTGKFEFANGCKIQSQIIKEETIKE